ncbi:hypothetical protein C0J52_07596, partial [Blattella germanica]
QSSVLADCHPGKLVQLGGSVVKISSAFPIFLCDILTNYSMHLKLVNNAFNCEAGWGFCFKIPFPLTQHFNGMNKLDKPLQNALSLFEHQACCNYFVFSLSR